MKRISCAFVMLLLSKLLFAQDVQLGSGIFEGEPYLAVNPINSNNVVVAWMHITPSLKSIRTRATFDGGQTWSPNNDIQHLFTNYADATMAFDNNGILYLAFINHTSGATDTGGVYSVKSTNGGLSWTDFSEIININSDGTHQPVDRPWIVCDRSGGVNSGNLYVTTKTVIGTPAPYRPYFIRSTDGANSWGNWRYLDTTNWLSGIPTAMVVPSVSKNGNFHGIYASYVTSQSPLPKYLMVSSNDGGASFTRSEVIPFIPGAAGNDSAKLAWQMLANPFDNYHLALFFVQGQSGDLDILMTETMNGGSSWSSVVRVNDDSIGNGTMQDLVWASFDSDGDLAVCWRDRRNDPGTGYAKKTEIFGAVRWKDSTAFSQNFVISDVAAPFNAILAEAGNDFLSQQLVNDTLYIAWGDTRTGFLNIWFDKIALQSGNSVGLTQLAHSEIPFVQVFPNPSSDFVELKLENTKDLKVTVYNFKGQRFQEIKTAKFSIANWTNGIYFLHVQADGKNQVLRLVKE
jgi:hypothetical protein